MVQGAIRMTHVKHMLILTFLALGCSKSGKNSAAGSSEVGSGSRFKIARKPTVEKDNRDAFRMQLDDLAEYQNKELVGVRASRNTPVGKNIVELVSKLRNTKIDSEEILSSVDEQIKRAAKIQSVNELRLREVEANSEVQSWRDKEAEFKDSLESFRSRKAYAQELIQLQRDKIVEWETALANRDGIVKELEAQLTAIKTEYEAKIKAAWEEYDSFTANDFGIPSSMIEEEVEKRYERDSSTAGKTFRRIGDWLEFLADDPYPETNGKKAELRHKIKEEIKDGSFTPPGVPSDPRVIAHAKHLKQSLQELIEAKESKVQGVRSLISRYVFRYDVPSVYAYGFSAQPPTSTVVTKLYYVDGKSFTKEQVEGKISAARTLISNHTALATSNFDEGSEEFEKFAAKYKAPLEKLKAFRIEGAKNDETLQFRGKLIIENYRRAALCLTQKRIPGALTIHGLFSDLKSRLDFVLQQDIPLSDRNEIEYFSVFILGAEGNIVALSHIKAPKAEMTDKSVRYNSANWVDLSAIYSGRYTMLACSHLSDGTIHSAQTSFILE
jgi:hypothetical protein